MVITVRNYSCITLYSLSLFSLGGGSLYDLLQSLSIVITAGHSLIVSIYLKQKSPLIFKTVLFLSLVYVNHYSKIDIDCGLNCRTFKP